MSVQEAETENRISAEDEEQIQHEVDPVGEHRRVDAPLDQVQRRLTDGAPMREVEPEAVRPHE